MYLTRLQNSKEEEDIQIEKLELLIQIINGFIRVCDSGEIEVFAAPGVGLIINPNTRSISFFADSIKFFCRDDDGLRWNEKSFNPAADVYNEPAFIKSNGFLNNPAYYSSSHYLANLDQFDQIKDQTPITIVPNNGRVTPPFLRDENSLISNLSLEQKRLVEDYSRSHTEEEVRSLIDLMSSGYSYQDAAEKVLDGDLFKSEPSQEYGHLHNDLDKK